MPYCPQNLINEYRIEKNGIPYECSSRIQFDILHDHIRSGAGIIQAVKDKQTTERTALFLCSFLAHWGMFRPSGNLVDRNLYFFQEICRVLLDKRKGVLMPIWGIPFENLHKIEATTLKNVIAEVQDAFRNVKGGFKPTNTLVSKTMLGLLGNVPAYDKFFMDGLRRLGQEREYNGTMAFGAKGLLDLSEWCIRYEWPSIPSEVDKRRKLPRGRLVDMAIHQYGRRE